MQHIYYYLSTFHRKNNKFKLDIFVTSAVIVGPTDIALVKIAAFYSTCAQLLTVTLRLNVQPSIETGNGTGEHHLGRQAIPVVVEGPPGKEPLSNPWL